MYRINRLRQLITDQGVWATLLVAWSWARWKLGGSQLPKSPASPGEWVTVHGGIRPPNPNPATRVSIVVSTHNATPEALAQTVASIRDQTHAAWQLILVDDVSGAQWMPSLLQEMESLDHRIQVVRLSESGGIAQAADTGIAAAAGDYVAFLDHGDLLVPTALEWVSVATARRRPRLHRRGQIDMDGDIIDRVLKPAWSPTLLLGRNYISNLSVVRTDLVRELGGVDPESGDSYSHDLLIRISEQRVTVAACPERPLPPPRHA